MNKQFRNGIGNLMQSFNVPFSKHFDNQNCSILSFGQYFNIKIAEQVLQALSQQPTKKYLSHRQLYSLISVIISMSNFFGKLKQAFTSKGPPQKFRHYQPSELKVIAMKTRLILQKNMQTILQHITKQDQQFKYAGQDANKLYNILQSIGQKVVQAESLKILIQMMRKIEQNSFKIIQTEGDVSKLRRQIQWMQSVLWYRRSREITNLEDLFSFCYNFFEGLDITTELSVNCEVFSFYPIMKYLPNKKEIPLHQLLKFIQPYVTYRIEQPVVDVIIQISHNGGKGPGSQGQSGINPGPYRPIDQQSRIEQKGSNYRPYVPPESPPQPYNINPYQTNPYEYPNQGNNQNNNPYQQHQSFNPQNPYTSYHNQGNYNHNSMYNPTSPYQPSKIHQNTQKPHNQANNQNIPHVVPQNPYPQIEPYQANNNNPSEQLNTSAKKSLYSGIMHGISRDRQSIQRDPHQQYGSQVPFKKENLDNFNNNDIDSTLRGLDQMESNHKQDLQRRQRIAEEEMLRIQKQKIDNIRKEQEEARRNIEEERQAQQIEDMEQDQDDQDDDELFRQFQEQVEAEKEIGMSKIRDQQSQYNLRKEQQQKRKIQQQAQLILQQQQKRMIQEEQKRQLQQYQKRRILQQEQRRTMQDEQQRKIAEEQQAKILQEQRMKLQEQLRLQREEDERQRQMLERRQERQRQFYDREDQFQINVFADNQREEIDRGTSGRFSGNFGMKVDFGDMDQGEDFNYDDSNQVRFSMLKSEKRIKPEQKSESKEEKVEKPVQDLSIQDQQQSLEIIKNNSDCLPQTNFKLFYFKRTQSQ